MIMRNSSSMAASRADVGENRGRGEKVAALVARQLVRDIARRDLQPGATLELEAAMLERFKISRASLREALRILETQGLITIKPGPGGGPSIAEIDSRDFARMSTFFFQVFRVRLREVVEARLIIEPVMASLAAARRDPDMVRQLDEVVRTGEQARSEHDWRAAANEFHSLVLGMSGNQLLTVVAKALKDIFTERVSVFAFPEGERNRVLESHRRVAKAIADGDAAAAEDLMREHMSEYSRSVTERNPGLMDEIVDWR